MKKVSKLLIGLIIINLFSCNKLNNSNLASTSDESINTTVEEDDNMELTLKIENFKVDVSWENNESVNELKNLAVDELIINMSRYGGFEQVGSLKTMITSSDTRITTIPGDIMLYSSNQIVIFYGSNTWEYTKLGHINLSKNELTNLLSNKDVSISLSYKY